MSKEAMRTLSTHDAARLRADFDDGFARPASDGQRRTDDFLAIRAGTGRYALRLSEIDALVADRKIVALPAPAPALLGLAGLRGEVLAVYDLGALLGHPAAEHPRWLAVSRGAARLALAFDHLDGYLRLRPEQIFAPPSTQVGSIGGTAQTDEPRPIIQLSALLHAVFPQPSAARAAQES